MGSKLGLEPTLSPQAALLARIGHLSEEQRVALRRLVQLKDQQKKAGLVPANEQTNWVAVIDGLQEATKRLAAKGKIGVKGGKTLADLVSAVSESQMASRAAQKGAMKPELTQQQSAVSSAGSAGATDDLYGDVLGDKQPDTTDKQPPQQEQPSAAQMSSLEQLKAAVAKQVAEKQKQIALAGSRVLESIGRKESESLVVPERRQHNPFEEKSLDDLLESITEGKGETTSSSSTGGAGVAVKGGQSGDVSRLAAKGQGRGNSQSGVAKDGEVAGGGKKFVLTKGGTTSSPKGGPKEGITNEDLALLGSMFGGDDSLPSVEGKGDLADPPGSQHGQNSVGQHDHDPSKSGAQKAALQEGKKGSALAKHVLVQNHLKGADFLVSLFCRGHDGQGADDGP